MCESPGLNPGMAWQTGILEAGRGDWNDWWSGEMRRYQLERRRRKRVAGPVLTLIRESEIGRASRERV